MLFLLPKGVTKRRWGRRVDAYKLTEALKCTLKSWEWAEARTGVAERDTGCVLNKALRESTPHPSLLASAPKPVLYYTVSTQILDLYFKSHGESQIRANKNEEERGFFWWCFSLSSLKWNSTASSHSSQLQTRSNETFKDWRLNSPGWTLLSSLG